MRVCTAFNKMLDVVGAGVASVSLAPEGIVVGPAPAPAQAPLSVRLEDVGGL